MKRRLRFIALRLHENISVNHLHVPAVCAFPACKPAACSDWHGNCTYRINVVLESVPGNQVQQRRVAMGRIFSYNGTIMKKLLVLAMTLAVASASAQNTNAAKGSEAVKTQAAAGQGPASKAHVLTNAELDGLLADPARVVIIDVRRPDELTAIGGFPVYLSIQSGDLEKSLEWIPRDRAIVTVSNHAGRAAKAADLLTARGFNVAGAVGAQSYEEAGGKLTKVVPRSRPAASAAAAKQ